MDEIGKLRMAFEDRITDPDMVEHLECGGFEYQHIVADEFEKALRKAQKERDKECRESGHLILRGEEAKRFQEALDAPLTSLQKETLRRSKGTYKHFMEKRND